MNTTESELKKIFEKHVNEKICVLGTTCCGKSTLQSKFTQAVDMDEELWPTLTKKEESFICQKPWTAEIGKFTNELVKERVVIKPGHPIFSLILLECEVIIYLDICDRLLLEHCRKRNASFEDAKNVKTAIEKAIRKKQEDNAVKIYTLEMNS